jgi:hypothetical protein
MAGPVRGHVQQRAGAALGVHDSGPGEPGPLAEQPLQRLEIPAADRLDKGRGNRVAALKYHHGTSF